jgi:hypothetical protein
MTIDSLMKTHTALTAEIHAIPLGQSIDEVFQRRWAIEEEILSRQATTLADRDRQISILAARAADGSDVSLDLARLAT